MKNYVNKRESVRLVTRFPESDEEQVARDIGNIINISDCAIDQNRRRMLCGRKRFAVSVATNIADGCEKELQAAHTFLGAKQSILDAAVDKAISGGRKQLAEQITFMLIKDKGGGV